MQSSSDINQTYRPSVRGNGYFHRVTDITLTPDATPKCKTCGTPLQNGDTLAVHALTFDMHHFSCVSQPTVKGNV